MTKVAESIQKIVKPLIKVNTIRGTVQSVDKTAQTCVVKPIRGGANYLDVKLDSTIQSDASYLIIYPKENSTVFISIIEGNDADMYVSKFGEIESISLKMNSNLLINVKESGELDIEAKQININGGNLGGLVKVQELQTQLTKINNCLKAIQTAFIGWITVPSDGGAVLKAASSTFTTLPLADTSNLANNKIKQ